MKCLERGQKLARFAKDSKESKRYGKYRFANFARSQGSNLFAY
jgi:hypothetical protein